MNSLSNFAKRHNRVFLNVNMSDRLKQIFLKKLSFLVILLLGVHQVSPAQKLLRQNFGHMLDVDFVDVHIGYILNNDSLLKTTDAGQTFQVILQSFIGNHIDIQGTNEIVCSGQKYNNTSYENIALYSNNAGNSWDTLYKSSNRNYGHVYYVSPTRFAFVNWTDTLFMHDVTSPQPGMLPVVFHDSFKIAKVKFFNSLTGYALVQKYGNVSPYSTDIELYKTNDAGLNWQMVFKNFKTGSNGFSCGFDFFDSNIGVVKANQKIFKTFDGGNTWDSLSLNPNGAGTGVYVQCPNANTAYIMYDSLYKLDLTANGIQNVTPDSLKNGYLHDWVYPYYINDQNWFIIYNELSCGFYQATLWSENEVIQDPNSTGNIQNNKSVQIDIYPNPVEERSIKVHLQNADKMRLKFFLTDMQGKKVQSWNKTWVPDLSEINLDLKASIVPGYYLLRVESEDLYLTRKILFR